jgi:uncharacterized repeat protein (TIGR03803 family)
MHNARWVQALDLWIGIERELMNTNYQQGNRWNRGYAQTCLRSLAIAVMFAVSLLAAQSAPAQTYTVLHTFSGGADGGVPLYVKLVRDSAGNLYGTTNGGGASGLGTLFRLDAKDKETVLHNFTGGTDGKNPASGVLRDAAGNLYGTTQLGGAPGSYGVVFELTAAGKFSVPYAFKGFSGGGGDGGYPQASLFRDWHGNLYGTTAGGGISTPQCQRGGGTVFKLTLANGSWTESLLYTFPCTYPDGMFPYAPLIAGPSGSLYGTTAGGGTCGGGAQDACGTVFQMTPGVAGWTHTVLYGFEGGSDGASVKDGLVRDSAGYLYGTTELGGTSGFGTIFRLDASGNKTVLHSFTGSDGAYPAAGLVRDTAGSLYGTANQGGSSLVGTVFQLDIAGNLTVLHNFTGGADGAYPYGPLLRSGGILYGTTAVGGLQNEGTVFKLKP